VSLIDDYVDDLRQALHGPRRAKEDLLREVADHLVDVADGHVRTGAAMEEAEELATGEFGPPGAISPGLQEVLDLEQASRTAVAILLGLGLQPLIWDGVWPLIGDVRVESGGLHEVLSSQIPFLGFLVIALAVLGLFASRVGIRIQRVRENVVRWVGVLGVVVATVMTGLPLFLTAISPGPSRFLEPKTTLFLALFMLIPMLWIGREARRCLRQG
jgi:uncharacterized membrane protein